MASYRPLFYHCKAAAVMAFLVAALSTSRAADEVHLRSRWDEELLKVELENVSIKTNSLIGAWREMGVKYLLRSNLYRDEAAAADSTRFSFKKERATGTELFDAFLAVYPAYTYSHDPKTGVIWLYPKRLSYDKILDEMVQIDGPAIQIPMLEGVYHPLMQLLSPHVVEPMSLARRYLSKEATKFTYSYGVDLPNGVYSARDIINFCCVADPTKAFVVLSQGRGRLGLQHINLLYDNPLAGPRAEAVRFWNTEIMETSAAPNLEEIGAALSDGNPRKRWAARMYLKATERSYRMFDLPKQQDAKRAAWAALGVKCLTQAGNGDMPWITLQQRVMGLFTNDLLRLDPGLGLLTAMEVAREKSDPGVLDVVAEHKFSSAEIEVIKPDLYRIARESKLVRNKLLKMKFEAPEMSSDVLNELGRTNLFELVPVNKN